MYESSNNSFFSIKYVPIIISVILFTVTLLIFFYPNFEITVNGVERKALLSDSYLPLFFGVVSFLFFIIIGRRVVKMRIDNNEFEFLVRGEKVIKQWSEVKELKKYWFVAPPLYSVRFENDEDTYFFTTKYVCIVLPFYVIDLSGMGSFIKKRKQDIPFLKELKKETIQDVQ